jgi:hypothetical protein
VDPAPHWQVLIDYGSGKEVMLEIPARVLTGMPESDSLIEAQDGLRRLAKALLSYAEDEMDKRVKSARDWEERQKKK